MDEPLTFGLTTDAIMKYVGPGYLDPESISLTQRPQLFALNGRIGRLRYVLFSLAVLLAGHALIVALLALNGLVTRGHSPGDLVWTLVQTLYGLQLLALMAIARRRLHDANLNGWLAVVLAIPLMNLPLLALLMTRAGDPTPNRFGRPPTANGQLVVAIVPVIFAVVGGTTLALMALPGDTF